MCTMFLVLHFRSRVGVRAAPIRSFPSEEPSRVKLSCAALDVLVEARRRTVPEAEVREDDLASVRDQEVVRLDVTVNEVLLVYCLYTGQLFRVWGSAPRGDARWVVSGMR